MGLYGNLNFQFHFLLSEKRSSTRLHLGNSQLAIFTRKRNPKDMVWIRETKQRKLHEDLYGLGIVRFFSSLTGAGLIKGG